MRTWPALLLLAAPAWAQTPLEARVAPNVNIVVPPGDYRLDQALPSADGVTWELSGTRFVGTGLLVDAGDWSPFLARIAKGWIKHDVEPRNAFGTVTAVTVGVTGAAASYEKAAGYDFIMTADPSTYTGSASAMADFAAKDAVGRQMTAVVAPGNRSGRVWGLTAVAQVSAGADGAAAAAEFDVVNNGSDQPVAGQPTSKTGVGILASGAARSTVALIVAPGGAQFHDGVLIRQDAVTDSAFRVVAAGPGAQDVFRVSPSGGVMASGLVVVGHVAGGGQAPVASAGALVPGSSDARGAVALAPGVRGSTLTFAQAFGSVPFCVVSGSTTTGAPAVIALSAASMTLAVAANAGGMTISWHCIQ